MYVFMHLLFYSYAFDAVAAVARVCVFFPSIFFQFENRHTAPLLFVTVNNTISAIKTIISLVMWFLHSMCSDVPTHHKFPRTPNPILIYSLV